MTKELLELILESLDGVSMQDGSQIERSGSTLKIRDVYVDVNLRTRRTEEGWRPKR